jgi:phospholipid/cholesterol/gamma-HCH transport system permease protein
MARSAASRPKTEGSAPGVGLDVLGNKDGAFTIAIAGRLDSATTGKIWRQANDATARTGSKRVVVDASRVEYCDGSGIALLAELRYRVQRAGGVFEIHGLRPEFQELLKEWGAVDLARSENKPRRRKDPVVEVGKVVADLARDGRALVAFVGELGMALFAAVRQPRRVRWKDMFLIAEAVGINALPIVTLIGGLMGLIMAFQAAVPLGRFGAQVYVANLIGLSILREMGPLMTAIVVAGRSGSAFAAEIGTMKVREEIDALITMGLDPVRYLVVTRVIAALIMTPALTMYANVVGILGGAVVLRSLGYSWIIFLHQVQWAVSYGSLVGGLVKSVVFAILVAAIGCLRGLQTGTGARAVGESTTSAVVSGIILIVIADGIFSIIYYYLWV